MKKVKAKDYAKRANDVPANRAMLFNMRDELKDFIKSEIHGINAKMQILRAAAASTKTEVKNLRSEIVSVHLEIKANVSGLHSKISSLNSKIDSKMHEMIALMEDQNARNMVVLDGLTNLFARQEDIRLEVREIKNTMADFKRLQNL